MNTNCPKNALKCSLRSSLIDCNASHPSVESKALRSSGEHTVHHLKSSCSVLLTHILLRLLVSQASGRSLAHLSQRDALRILAATQRPITMQIKGQRSTEVDVGSWEPLPLNLQHLNLPLPMMGTGLNASSPSYQDRYTHIKGQSAEGLYSLVIIVFLQDGC